MKRIRTEEVRDPMFGTLFHYYDIYIVEVGDFIANKVLPGTLIQVFRNAPFQVRKG